MEFISLLVNDATFYSILLQLAMGLVLGLAMGLTGVGGGILIIPLLQFVFHMEPVLAVGTASLIASLVKVNASFCHIKTANVDWRSVKGILLGAIPIGMLSASTVVYLHQHEDYNQLISTTTQVLIVLMMFYALFSLMCKYIKSQYPQQKTMPLSATSNWSYRRASSLGAFCGLIIGMTGIGGGVLLLPALNSYLGIGIKKAVGSSIVIALALSASTSFIYAKGGQSDIPTAFTLVVGSLLGVPLSTLLLKQLSEAKLYLTTLSVICVSILIMMLSNIL